MSLLLANETASGHFPIPQSMLCSSIDCSGRSELLLIEPAPTVLSSRTIMLNQSGYRITAAVSYKEVVCLRGTKVHLAVVSASLCPDNLRAITEIIRGQWTSARILVVGDAAPVLEDQLYDEAIDSRSSSEELLAALRKLSAFPTGNGGDASSADRGFLRPRPPPICLRIGRVHLRATQRRLHISNGTGLSLPTICRQANVAGKQSWRNRSTDH